MNKKSKLLCHTDFLDLYESSQKFYYAQRKGINSIAALCFKKNLDGSIKFLVHYQGMPNIAERKYLNQKYACPITGSIENNEDPLNCALREVYEEGGIKITAKNFVAVNKVVATTQMNEQIFCFLFNVKNLKQGIPKTDGSIFEQNATNKWMTQKKLESILFDQNKIKLSSLLICYLLWLNTTH